jgi:hypothetical protein
MKPMRLWLHGSPSGLSLSLVSYSIGPFTKLTSLSPIHKPLSRWKCTWSFPQVFTPSTGSPRITSSSYLPTSTGKSKPAACGTSYLVTKLHEINFNQSLIDDCLFYQDDVIFIVYINDGVFLGSSDQQLPNIINKLRNLKLSIKDQGHHADYVGVSVKKLKDGIIELSQQALINSIIADVALGDSTVKAVPAKVSKILRAHLDKPPFLLNFGYQSMIGKLNYLAQTTLPDIVYATHQLAKYLSNPKEPYGEAVLYLIRYLKKTCEDLFQA